VVWPLEPENTVSTRGRSRGSADMRFDVGEATTYLIDMLGAVSAEYLPLMQGSGSNRVENNGYGVSPGQEHFPCSGCGGGLFGARLGCR
jgi:hypothetical protein